MPGSARRCVLLFSRSAEGEGRAKRLERATALFALARRRVAAAVAALPEVDLLVVGSGPIPRGAHALPQRGRSFGERLCNAFAAARALGYRQVVAVPTDVPGLGARQLTAAFACLAERPLVLGPSPDGGVYLLGCALDPSALFAEVPWCTTSVFSQLLAHGAGAAVLDPLPDVDSGGDLRRLARGGGLDPELAALLAALLAPPRLSPRPTPAPRRPPLPPQLSPRAPPAPLAATSVS